VAGRKGPSALVGVANSLQCEVDAHERRCVVVDTVRFRGKYLSLTTYRRDGRAVATPVWFVDEDGRLLVQTDLGSGKVKRIRENSTVSLALCNARGRPRGDQVEGHAEVVGASETAHIDTLIRRKYQRDMLVIAPLRWAQTTFHLGKDRGPTVGLAITPGPPA
jgi:uncharacterized protein